MCEKKINDLPLVGRNPMNLFFLQAGANRVSNFRVDFNGLRNTTSNVQIEGIAAVDNMLTGGAADTVAPLIVEAMAEYSVTTSSAAAEAGLGGGAQILMVYKSGTNEYHGSVFEFHRNKALNANSFYRNRQGEGKPAFRRHQYGFAPIYTMLKAVPTTRGELLAYDQTVTADRSACVSFASAAFYE